MQLIRRRSFLLSGMAGTAMLAAPAILRAQDSPIRIGAMMPTQGAFAVHGEAGRQGIEVAVAQHGALLGRPVELVWGEEATPQEAQQNMQKLVNEAGVCAVLGGTNSATGLAMASVGAQSKCPTVITGAAARDITGKTCDANVFRVNATASAYARNMARYLLPISKNWYFVAGAYAYGQDLYDVAKAELIAAGGTEAGVDMVPVGTADFSSIILKIRQAAPGYVFLGIGGTDLATFLKQYAEFGMQESIPVAISTINDDEIWAQTEPTGVMGKFWHYNNPANSPAEIALNEEIVKLTGHPASQASANAWAGTRMLLAAIEKAASIEREAILANLVNVRSDSVPGYFRDFDHQFITRLVLGKVRAEITDKYDALEIAYTPATYEEAEALYDTPEQSGCVMPKA